MREYELTVNGRDFKLRLKSISSDRAEIEVNGQNYEVDIRSAHQGGSSRPRRRVESSVQAETKGLPAASVPTMSGGAGAGGVSAPIPGAILEVFVKEGDSVKAGQPLLKMEAMKMENVINATREGSVTKIHVKAGDSVNQGQTLVDIT